ncbi:hypothetical protein AAH979_22395 [Plantactinospora sp. ZYX-F-223]|uniref:hypothetical protein n=1 Tax=Plantactinospora sp. ZYX-F-223 TaxID=3144103 RepID=UPI0031FBE0B7
MPTDPNQHQLSISVPSAVPSLATPTGSTTLRMARRRRAALLGEIHVLEQAIAAPARDPGWRPRVRSSLGGLRGAFAEHMVSTEGPDGLYAELLDHAPRLARGVHVLIREHAAVVATMAALQRRVDLPDIGVTELRNRATDLLRELSRHRQRGADLVYEAYQTDIGGET